MELYFKNLISKEASLEKLVDDLTLVVHGADDYARAMGAALAEPHRSELMSRLERLKENCRQVRERAVAGAQATDRLLRANPYWAFGIAFSAGALLGCLFCRRR